MSQKFMKILLVVLIVIVAIAVVSLLNRQKRTRRSQPSSTHERSNTYPYHDNHPSFDSDDGFFGRDNDAEVDSDGGDGIDCYGFVRLKSTPSILMLVSFIEKGLVIIFYWPIFVLTTNE